MGEATPINSVSPHNVAREQPGPETVMENDNAGKVGSGIINLKVTSSRLEVTGQNALPDMRHDVPPPGPSAVKGMNELGSVANANVDLTVDILSIVKTLMTKMISVMSDLHQEEHKMMSDARHGYSKSVKKKVKNMKVQAASTMGFGISSAAVSGGFSIGAATIAFKSNGTDPSMPEVKPEMVMAQTQAVTGLGHATSGVLDATGKGVNINQETKNARMDKYAQLYQGFQSEFQEAVNSAKQAMQSSNQALSEAGSKDDSAMGVVISKLG